ncbi:hypothetical protein [Nonomuraea fuscirosea]|uniref:hypothetical protein n=1 Tax=Nonomuraea fuscirosea TaxID=1291556 RepID=UPI00341C8C7C
MGELLIAPRAFSSCHLPALGAIWAPWASLKLLQLLVIGAVVFLIVRLALRLRRK